VKLESRDCPVCLRPGERVVYHQARFDPARFSADTFSSRKTPERMHFRYVRCTACDVLFADPAPDAAWLESSYREAAFGSSVEAGFASRTYARALGPVFRRLAGRGRALDVGTGEGSFLGELLAAGFAGVAGIEPSREAIAQADPRVRPLIRQGTFGPGSLAGAEHALITCFQTLEHVPRPAELVAAAAAALVPGGAFAAVIHNYHAISTRALGEASPIFDVEHLQLFSPRSARVLLERAGLAEVSVRSIVNTYPLSYWVRVLPLADATKARLLGGLARARAAALPVPLPVGNLLAVGFAPGRSTR
jgi:SAM-dependent methyltransferase